MKKILTSIILLVSINSFAQNLDTVYVRNLSLKKETWCVLSTFFPTSDSLGRETYIKIFNVMKDHKNDGFSTQIIFDSLPGGIAIDLHRRFRSAPQLIQDKIGNEYFTKLAAYTPISSFVTAEDNNNTNIFNSFRDKGAALWFRHKIN